MENKIIDFLNMPAWSMDAPRLFGGFHIAASFLTAVLAVMLAVFFARRIESAEKLRRILVTTGWLLFVLEVYKQCFLYFLVNDRAFDFWFFPFQLCSIPMYLCILLPFMKDSLHVTFMTFMSGYTFVSATATLVFPEDILRPYITLTAHGFIWHGLLLFISLLIFITGYMDAGTKGLRSAAILFVILSVMALGINIAVEPVMPAIRAAHPAVKHDWAAMFYLNPFHISPQPVISSIQKTAGIPAGLVLYTLIIAAVSSVIIKCYVLVSKRK